MLDEMAALGKLLLQVLAWIDQDNLQKSMVWRFEVVCVCRGGLGPDTVVS